MHIFVDQKNETLLEEKDKLTAILIECHLLNPDEVNDNFHFYVN